MLSLIIPAFARQAKARRWEGRLLRHLTILGLQQRSRDGGSLQMDDDKNHMLAFQHTLLPLEAGSRPPLLPHPFLPLTSLLLLYNLLGLQQACSRFSFEETETVVATSCRSRAVCGPVPIQAPNTRRVP